MDSRAGKEQRRSNSRTVTIEFEPGDGQPHGRVDAGDGTRRPFWGWLELIQSIEDLGIVRQADAARPS